ncbi:hypothetical protein KT99_19239 [Shewanella benthica KT99]|uniref:Teneurin-like YD-shell domain-containing protein n=2 Tax=Shewanella benthica TaxID=43661 RepID=A9DE09_9GAMM|nr:hypothetical protein KT99_19239 [Shewanella benthica KT99]
MNTKGAARMHYISKLIVITLCLVIAPLATAQTVRYQHTDMLGTPVMETDESGNVISRSVYEPFGKRLGGEKEGIGFTGHLQDEDLGLTYMQARYYDPLIGRFYSNDPLPFRDVHSFNRYSYAANNPYKYTDPNGKDFKATYLSIKIPFAGSVDIGTVGFSPNSAGEGSTTSGMFVRINTSASNAESDASKGVLKQTGMKTGVLIGATIGKEAGTHTSETFQGTDASIDVGLGPVSISLGGLASGETSVATELGVAFGADATVSQTISLTNEDIGNAASKVVDFMKEIIE